MKRKSKVGYLHKGIKSSTETVILNIKENVRHSPALLFQPHSHIALLFRAAVLSTVLPINIHGQCMQSPCRCCSLGIKCSSFPKHLRSQPQYHFLKQACLPPHVKFPVSALDISCIVQL